MIKLVEGLLGMFTGDLVDHRPPLLPADGAVYPIITLAKAAGPRRLPGERGVTFSAGNSTARTARTAQALGLVRCDLEI